MSRPGNSDPEAVFIACAHFVTYAGAVANTDLTAEGKAPCRRLRCEAAGTLFVKRASDKTQITLNFKAGESQDVSATDLVAGGTATDVTAYW